jgi:hypothetical protein
LLPGARPHNVEAYAPPQANGLYDRGDAAAVTAKPKPTAPAPAPGASAAKSAAPTLGSAARAAETAESSPPLPAPRPVARGSRRGKRIVRPEIAADQPTAAPTALPPPTVIVPPGAPAVMPPSAPAVMPPGSVPPGSVPAFGARANRGPDNPGNWRYASRSTGGDYDRGDWRNRDDRPNLGGLGGGFLGLFGFGDGRD